MAIQLATGVFTSGPKDEFATVDAYKSSGEEIINSLPINLKDAKDIFAAIKVGSNGFDLMGTAKGLSKTVLGEYLKTSASGLGLKLPDLGASVLEKTTTLLEKTGVDAQAVMCTIGEYTNKASALDMGRITKLGYALTQVKGVDGIVKVVNQAQNSALLSNLIGEASDLGVGGALSSLKGVIDDNGLISRVVKSSIPFVLKNSDVSLLRELTSGGVGNVLNSIAPGFTKSFASVYNPQYSYNFNRVGSFNSIVDAFDSVYNGWDQGKQNGQDIFSIFSMLSGTKAFKTLVGSGVAWIMGEVQDEQKKKRAQAHALSRIYAESTVKDQIQRYFPGLIMAGSYTRRSQKEETISIQVIGRSLNAFLS